MADKDECTKSFPNVFTFSTSISEASGNTNRGNSSHSGIVILIIATLPIYIHDNHYDGTWENKLYDKVRSCKPNVFKSYDHHGFKGACFSFGNKPFYGIVNNNSVGVYMNLKHDNQEKQRLIDEKSKDIENMCWKIIQTEIMALSGIMPGINIHLSPVLYAADAIQKTKFIVGLTTAETSNLGC